MDIRITLEEFKLVKSFYPEFTRKQGIQSNDFIIGWSELMPVVEKIERMYTEEVDQFNKPLKEQALADVEYSKVLCLNITAGIEITYKSVVEFIKWYKNNKQ